MGSTFWEAQNKLGSARDLGSSPSWPEVGGVFGSQAAPHGHVGKAPKATIPCGGANQNAPEADLKVPLSNAGAAMAPSSLHTPGPPPP